MAENGTPIAIGGVVAIAALLFAPFGAKGPNSKRPSQSAVKPPAVSGQASPSSGGSATSETLSRDDRGPWYALCQEFAGDQASAHPQPSTEQLEEIERTVKDEKGEHKYTVRKKPADDIRTCVGNFADFRFLIATVSDPIGSHLDIEFDRALESLMRAATVEGYSFERYWLPWRPGQVDTVGGAGSSSTPRTEERQRREQPGLLIFRKPSEHAAQPDQRLLIFLVGETPTAGLNRPAFLKSLRYIDQLTIPLEASTVAGQQHSVPSSAASQHTLTISIAGPIFSATLPPLGEAIEEYSSNFAANDRPVFHVVNYGARSDSMIDAFKGKLQRVNRASTFSSFDLTVKDAQKEIIDYLNDLGYESNEIAVLGEDGSAYGNAILEKSEIVSLHFPRDLSSIRNATETENSDAEPQQIAGVNIPTVGVTLTLRQEQTNEHDSPPDFAQTQSSARIDRALQAMVKRLRTLRIQAVIVTATNPLDRVFLLEYLHLTVPDVRLAVVGADDFMLARPRFIDLSGTLAVTSLPLTESTVLVESTSGEKPKQLAINFPSNAAEGIFLAAANLLGPRPELNSPATSKECADISIVGKTGFRSAVIGDKRRSYPCLQKVDESNKPTTTPSVTVGKPGSVKSATSPAKRPASDTATSPSSQSAKQNPVPFIWIMALISLLVVSTVHMGLVCSSNKWLGMRHLPKVPRFAVSSSSVRQGQLFFLFTATNQILLLEWIAVTTTYPLSTNLLGYQQALLGAHVVLLVCSVLLCGWLVFQIASKAGGRYSRTVLAFVILCLLFVAFASRCWWLLLSSGEPTWNPDLARLVAIRTAYFLEGLSPLLPVFFVLLAFYLWSMNNLQRLSMVVMRVSLCIPKDNTSSTELANIVSELQASIRPAIDLKPSALVLMGLTVVLCCLVRLTSALRGFEFHSFRWLVCCGFVLLLLILVATFHRAWDVWSQLRKVLHFLDSALLGGAFSHVPKGLASMRIWSFGGARISLMVQVRTAELLQRMADRYPLVTARASAAAGGSAVSIPTNAGTRPESPGEASAFSALRDAARILDTMGALDRPLAKKISTLLNCRMPQTAFLFDPEASAESALRPGEKNLLELYLAYRFVAFFRYVMRQIRHMLSFVIYGYACLVVAATVYPFQGRQSLGALMSFVFVLLLGGVAAMMVQMYRDPLLKRLEQPSSGLSGTFEIAAKLIGVAGVPLLAVLASQFPSFAEVVMNWLRPLVEASH
jgi:hypothetical protein